MMQAERDLEDRLRRDATAVRREALPDASFHHRIMARVNSTGAAPLSVKRSFRLPVQFAFAAGLIVVALAVGVVFSRLSALRPAYRNDGAPPLVGAMIAADPVRHQVVLFGGGTEQKDASSNSDTWTWDGSSWTRRHPVSSPPARSNFSMSYDAARRMVVIFGGIAAAQGTSSWLNDTWEWNGTTWTEAHPTVVPPPTLGAPMAYDPKLGRTVLVDGGFTWTWDGKEWSKGAPAPIFAKAVAGMAFDPASGSLVILAFSQAKTQTPETWYFDGRAWTAQAGLEIPADTKAAAWPILLAEDPLSGSLMGVDWSGGTWSWDGSRWTVLNVRKVSAGASAAITYDPTRHLVLLFGGVADGRVVSDLSAWDGKQWLVLPGGGQAKTLPTPPAATGPRPSLSLGVSGAGADWVVRRPNRPTGPANILYQSVDSGRTWQKRLEFQGFYDGMSWGPGESGVIWSVDWLARSCSGASSPCTLGTQSLTAYGTTDGGHHWTARAPTSWPASAVYFLGLEGWAISSSFTNGGGVTTLYHTADGGTSWVAVGPAPGYLAFSSGFGTGDNPLKFVSSQRGWFTTRRAGKPGDSGLMVTTDGGHSWTPQTVQPPAGVAQSEMIVGYPEFLTDGNMLLPTFVGRYVDLGVQGQNPAGAPQQSIGTFMVSRSYIYSSSDGGITWANPEPLNAPNGMRPTDQFSDFFLDSLNWWFTAIGQPSAGEQTPQASETIGRTTNGGKTWQVFTSPGTIVQLRFTDAARGWALAFNRQEYTNALLRTTDGGAHWQRVQIP